MEFNKIKLIIWDLDDTLWNGTLSEESVSIPANNKKLILALTDYGIINSICSKNEESEVLLELEKIGLSDYFVFKSINWEPKGKRVASIIRDMSLRPENVLFIDDNKQNIEEVAFYNKGIMTELPEVINDLEIAISQVIPKDLEHKRLKQYHILETKKIESLTYADNVSFLFSCDIHIVFFHDCIQNVDRLYELIIRTNQLNFTKQRPTIEVFANQLSDKESSSGYVRVYDRFGDYGIVGFYQIKHRKLTHFVFSCRTIGLGIEQYVYAKIGYPEIEVVQPVASNLDCQSCPKWIVEGKPDYNNRITSSYDSHVLFKGPCDMQGMVGYLRMGDKLDAEFTFTNEKGELIETHNHSAHIFGLKAWSSESKQRLQNECFFFCHDCYSSRIYNAKVDLVFLSTLIEGMYGLYRRNGTGEVVAFGHYNYPLTDKKYWPLYLNQQVQTYGYHISPQDLEAFSEKYSFIGRRTPSDYIIFLDFLLQNLPEATKLCLILGTEQEYYGNTDPSYTNRQEYHREMNEAIRQYALHNARIRLLEIDSAVSCQTDFSNNINHYSPSVYYRLSQEALRIIEDVTCMKSGIKINKTKFFLKQYVQPFVYKVFSKRAYSKLRQLGRYISGE